MGKVLLSKDPAFRAGNISTMYDPKMLQKLALQDPDSMVRVEAVKKIKSVDVLIQVAVSDIIEWVRYIAIVRLKELLLEEIEETISEKGWSGVFEFEKMNLAMFIVIINDESKRNRKAASSLLSDLDLIEQLVGFVKEKPVLNNLRTRKEYLQFLDAFKVEDEIYIEF